jgi:hypothetical protein
MSLLQHSLELFGFSSINDITPIVLKKALKTKLMNAHPDKGGDENDIDKLLNSYVFLSENLQRLTGGRATLQNITSPEDLKGARANELINKIFEEFDLETFNTIFEKEHISENTKGYSDWLKNKVEDNNVEEGEFGEATIKRQSITDLNSAFEETYKPSQNTQSLIIHPDEMATFSGKNMGVSIINTTGGTFTSDFNTRPEYTDVFSAYTADNTLTDKVPVFKERTLEQIMKEREEELKPTEDDLAKISMWEQAELEKEKKHLEKVNEYYGGQYNGFHLSLNYKDTSSSNFIVEISPK